MCIVHGKSHFLLLSVGYLINSKIIKFQTLVNGVHNYYFTCTIATSTHPENRMTIAKTKTLIQI